MSPPTVSLSFENPFAHLPRLDGGGIRRAAARVLDFHGFDDAVRQDTSAVGFTGAFARQLEYLYPEIARIEFADFKARTLFPVDSSPGPAAEFFTYRQFEDVSGMAAITQDFAEEGPRPAIKGQEFPQRIVSLTASYGYNIHEMRQAAMANVALDAEMGRMARDMVERRIEDMAATGVSYIKQPDGSTAMYGLVGAPNVTATTQASSNDWITQYNADTSAGKTTSIAAMVADLAAMRVGSAAHPTEGIFTKTKGKMGDIGQLSLIFPTVLYGFLASTPRSISYDSTGQTLLEYIVKTAGFKDASFWWKLDTAGGSNKGRVYAYRKDPSVVRLMIPQEFEQFAPQPRAMGFVIPCHARCGALQVRRPLEITYMDGISP